MKTFLKYSAISFVVLFWMASCTERIKISTHEGESHLVIYGYITTELTHQAIQISRSNSFFAENKPDGISNATVSIQTGAYTVPMREQSPGSGLYLSDVPFAGVEGESYTLHVSLDFDGDGVAEEYTASSYLPHAVRLDSIGLQVSSAFKDMAEIVVFGELPDNERNYLSFHAYKNRQIINDSLINSFIIDDKYLGTKNINGIPCFFLDQEEEESIIDTGDLITLRIDVLNEDYAHFLMNGADEVSGKNPIFSGPPANIESNIRQTGNTPKIPLVGFFSAFSGRESSTVVKEELMRELYQ